MGEFHRTIKAQPSRKQRELVAAMMDPGFYPKPPAEVLHKETHISHVFLAGDLVYKIKKAVRYPFLDYSTLSKRRHFLQEELRLNRRLAPSVYLAVMPITCDSAGWALGGWHDPREYALVMRRLPERLMLTALLDSTKATEQMMGRLAEVLGQFHLQAERIFAIAYRAEVQREWNDNLLELRPFAARLVAAQELKTLENFGVRFIERHCELLERRARQGWIRDVHGDLHCEHVCFAPEGIQIYDCIEFSAKLRRCDLAAEIAFLLMDLDVRGGGSLRAAFLNRYLEVINDPELPLLLPFYECYGALVRAKMEALRSETASSRAPHYLEYALALTWQPLKPFLVLVSGLTGSGKSTLSRELARRLRICAVNSDAVRKELAGNAGRKIVSFEAEIYTQAMTERTYDRMADLARAQVLSGEGAILDATFSTKKNRTKFRELAEEFRIPLLVIHCFASEQTTRARLARRRTEGADISDGHWEIYQRQKQLYEPLEEISRATRLELDTENDLGELVGRSLEFLRSELWK